MSRMFILSRLYGSLSRNPRMHLTMKWKRELSIGCTRVESELICHTCVKILGTLVHFKLHLSTLLVGTSSDTYRHPYSICLESTWWNPWDFATYSLGVVSVSFCIPIILDPIFKLWLVGLGKLRNITTTRPYLTAPVELVWFDTAWHCPKRIGLSFFSEAIFLFLKTADQRTFIKVPHST